MSIRSTHITLTGAAAAALLTLTGCADDATENAGNDVEATDQAEATDQPAAGGESADGEDAAADRLTFAELSEQLQDHTGEPVTVTAEVGKVLEDDAFTITTVDESAVDPMLVVSAETVQVEQGADVVVAGTLRESFALPKIEEELGVELDDDRLAEWEQGHYMVATSVNPDAEDTDADPYVDVEGDPGDAEDDA